LRRDIVSGSWANRWINMGPVHAQVLRYGGNVRVGRIGVGWLWKWCGACERRHLLVSGGGPWGDVWPTWIVEIADPWARHRRVIFR